MKPVMIIGIVVLIIVAAFLVMNFTSNNNTGNVIGRTVNGPTAVASAPTSGVAATDLLSIPGPKGSEVEVFPGQTVFSTADPVTDFPEQ